MLPILALVLAVLALLLVAGHGARLRRHWRAIEELQGDLRERCRALNEHGRQTEAELREMIARLAGGEAMTPEQVRSGRTWRDVTAEQAQALLAAGARVLDVRSEAETASGMLPGALHIPIDELPSRLAELPREHGAMLVYCAGGGRSAQACQLLGQQGYGALHNLLGGIQAWTGPIAPPR